MCEKVADDATVQVVDSMVAAMLGRFSVMLSEPEAHENLLAAKDHTAGPTSIPKCGGRVVLTIVAEAAEADRGRVLKTVRTRRARGIKNESSSSQLEA